MSKTSENPLNNGLIEGVEVFRSAVNIDLFNDIIAFVAKTTTTDTVPVLRKLEANHLWYKRSANGNIQEQYGFRYLGELLERFEDKAGSDICNIRAIALALAYSEGLLSGDMFVGNQKKSFIERIKALMLGDVYLKGAVYLLTRDAEDNILLDELAKEDYCQTEELVFLMSLYDDFEQAFIQFKPQLLNLLCASRSISVFGNMGIFSWLIKKLDACVKKHRSKDMAFFRALVALPTSFVKAGSKSHDTMLENGYTPEEIIYANGLTLLYRPLGDTLRWHSIVAEKIVIELCITFINSENTHSGDTYAYLYWLLDTYEDFEIKIQGFTGIINAIKHDIRLSNPKTFLWLFKQRNKRKDLKVFHFDIMDAQWDVLAEQLSLDEYLNLFETQLSRCYDHTPEQVKAYIQKYDSLTNSSFISCFESEHLWHRDNIFRLLVEKELLGLISVFESCPVHATYAGEDIEKQRPAILKYIGNLIKSIHCRKSFDFFVYFFEKYDFSHMINLFTDKNRYSSNTHFFADTLYDSSFGYRNHNENQMRIKIKRDFLSDDEHRLLHKWLDEFIFLYKPDDYLGYAIHMLNSPFIRTLYSIDELRPIYDAVRETANKELRGCESELKHIFLSEDELQAEKDAENAREMEQKRIAEQNRIQGIRNKFKECFDGSIKSFGKFLDGFKYSRDKDIADALRIAGENIATALEHKNYTLGKKEMGRFVELCGRLIKREFLTFPEFLNYLTKIKEDESHAEDSRTADADSSVG